MERLYNTIINEMTNAKIIDDNQDTIECYHYGLELVTTSLIIFVVMFVISIFTKTILECILFAVFFCPLRAMSGGYHCKSFLSCFILSLSIWILYIILSRFSIIDNNVVVFVLFITSSIYIGVNAPLEHPNNPLSNDEKTKIRKRIRLMLSVYIIISILLIVIKSSFISIMYYSIYVTMLLMILGRIGGESYNESNMSEADSEN